MGGKRIIIETGDEVGNPEHTKQIEEKLDAISKKLMPPFLLPVIVTIVTAIATYINYCVQRNFSNSDLYRNKVREKIADLRATSDVAFFKRSVELLDTIDVTFESFCKIDTSAKEDSVITWSLIRLNNLVSHQLIVDTALRRKIHAYTEYVADEGIARNAYPGKDSLKIIYASSYLLYRDTRKEIDATLDNLTK